MRPKTSTTISTDTPSDERTSGRHIVLRGDVNRRDEHHAMAVEWMTASSERIITSEWVLAELGNYLAEGPNRRLLGLLVRALMAETRVEIIPADHNSFLAATSLY